MSFFPTEYRLVSQGSGVERPDEGWTLAFPDDPSPALVRTLYAEKQLRLRDDLPGLYRFADWLPIGRVLEGSAAPVTYRSEGLAREWGLDRLWITFNGWWPERGADMKSGTFKECEAYSVAARMTDSQTDVLVVASAGNTARAFARVCSDNKIPLLLSVPEDNLDALWFDAPLDPCVKLISPESGGDYFDAIRISGAVTGLEGFFPEGGAKNVARRDGMSTTVYSAVTTIGKIPDVYFQAVGSGTGAIAAWEANLRFLDDGRFGTKKMRLMVSQNEPFIPMKNTWDAQSRELIIADDATARRQVEEIKAKVLSNRRPPWGVAGGLFDALTDTGGTVITASNEEAARAAETFRETEGNDVTPAAAVAVASLRRALNTGLVDPAETVMLNITGGGVDMFQKNRTLYPLAPNIVFPLDVAAEDIGKAVSALY